MGHLAKEIPYRDTRIPASATMQHIAEMLKEFGASALRWTETADSMRGVTCPLLEFILDYEWNGVQHKIGIRLQAPLLAMKRRQNGRTVTAPNLNVSLRLLYWYLKARLEATRFGLEDVMESLMSKVIVSLPDALGVTRSTTLGQVFRERPQAFTQILPSFEIRMLEA